MKLIYNKSMSDTYPDLIDTVSSKTAVWIRKNVIKIEDPMGNATYEYDEAKLTKEQYKEYLQEIQAIDYQQLRADIDYIALMSGVNLEG